MAFFDKHREAIKKLTPKSGFNVVGVDKLERPREELFLVGHFDAKAEADKVCAAKNEASDPAAYVYYVYDPDSSCG